MKDNFFAQFVQSVPEESCNLIPSKVCTPVTRVVPTLVPTRRCVSVPKEICDNVRRRPRKVTRPIVKKWCGPNPKVSLRRSA